jgi:transposase
MDERSDVRGSTIVRALHTFGKVYVCRLPVDGRKHSNTLAAWIEFELGQTPFDGSMFVFINKRFDLIKLLYYDQTGFAIWIKRLEKSRYRWITGAASPKVFQVTSRQLEMLLDGYDIFRMKPHEPVNFSRSL